MSKPAAQLPPHANMIRDSKLEFLTFAAKQAEVSKRGQHSVFPSFVQAAAPYYAKGELEHHRVAQERLLETNFDLVITNRRATLETQAKGETGDGE